MSGRRRGAGLKVVIREFLRERGPMMKGQLEEVVREATRAYGDTTARRLREMTQDGEVVKSVDGERTTWYELAVARQATATRLNAEPIEA
jgi:hypothetical protein